MIDLAFEVYRYTRSGMNFYPIKEDRGGPYSGSEAENKLFGRGYAGLSQAANEAIAFMADSDSPIQNDEILIVRNVRGGLAVFKAVAEVRAERFDLS